MPSRMPNKPAPEKLEELERLRYSVKRANEKGNFDTAHHEMLRRLEAELNIQPERTEGKTTDEVNNGK